MARAIDQAAIDKRVQERRAANKKRAAERKEARAKKRAAKKAAKKPVSVEKTKGGDYPVYKKKSKEAKSFREAFKSAGGKNFTWEGRSYSGKKAAPKKAAPKPEVKTEYEKMAERKGLKPSFSKGGKVEASNPYGWPTNDARSGLSKKK